MAGVIGGKGGKEAETEAETEAEPKEKEQYRLVDGADKKTEGFFERAVWKPEPELTRSH
jgi:hypothetical protein